MTFNVTLDLVKMPFRREQAKSNIKKRIHEKLPDEYEKCLVGLNSNTRTNADYWFNHILGLPRKCVVTGHRQDIPP